MEKELLQKVYNLKKIKPDAGFVEDAKKNILSQRKEERPTLISFLTSPVVQNNSAVLSAGFVFLLVFGIISFPLFPSNVDYNIENLDMPPRVATVDQTEEDEVIKELPEDEDNNVEVAQEISVERRFSSVESNVRDITRQVLGTLISSKEAIPEQDVTDKEIAKHIAKGLQGKEVEKAEQPQMGIMSVPEEPKADKDKTEERDYSEDPEIKEALKLYEEESYEDFIHTMFDLLEVDELLDILSE